MGRTSRNIVLKVGQEKGVFGTMFCDIRDIRRLFRILSKNLPFALQEVGFRRNRRGAWWTRLTGKF